MAIYSLDGTTSILTINAATAELRTSATDQARLYKWFWGYGAAAASAFTLGLGRPGATGITPTAPVTWIAEDAGSPAGTAQIENTGWVTPPTVPPNFFRRTVIFHVKWVLWEFPGGIGIDVSSSLVLWTLVHAGVAVMYSVSGEE